MKDKILTIIVSRNNPVLLRYMFDTIERYSAGYDTDIVIADASSDQPAQLKVLEGLSKKYTIQTVPNGRVETNYSLVWKERKDYRYYFFLHDDMSINANDWLKVFVDRINSRYSEPIIENTHLKSLPIGKVCLGHQPWRSYDSILGYPVQCLFLKHALDFLYPSKTPEIFKYCDGDRVLISNECITATNGFRHTEEYKDLKTQNPQMYEKLCSILHQYLQHADEGMYPKSLYPAGECWNKLTLLSEFLNSIDPLLSGYRTVGLYGTGYLEQINGFDVPYQHRFITHLGSPNVRQFLGRKLNTDKEEIKKHFNDKIFLMKCDKLVREYINTHTDC